MVPIVLASPLRWVVRRSLHFLTGLALVAAALLTSASAAATASPPAAGVEVSAGGVQAAASAEAAGDEAAGDEVADARHTDRAIATGTVPAGSPAERAACQGPAAAHEPGGRVAGSTLGQRGPPRA